VAAVSQLRYSGSTAAATGERVHSAVEVILLPAWASECIARAVGAFLARADSSKDADLVRVAGELRAWPVYGDLGGVLLLAPNGAVYCRDNNTMEVRPELDPGWRQLAWAAAAEAVPELRPLLPARPDDAPDCTGCGGVGQVQITPNCRVWCGSCWGQGWRQQDAAEAEVLSSEPHD